MATVTLPTALRGFAANRAEVQASGATVREVLVDLGRQCPGLLGRVLDDAGAVRRYVNVFLNDEDIRFLAKLDTEVGARDRLAILVAIAGG